MSVVEATLDNPGPVLAAQLDRVKTEALAAMKAAGVEYEERIEALDKLEYPKPLRDWTYDLFDAYRIVHPWAADFNIQPKSVARDLYERAMTFSEYVAHYGLTRSEGLVLRYLSDVYKGLIRNVPEDLKTEELLDVTEWLGELVRQVDSSLIDEWERLAAAGRLALPSGRGDEIGLETTRRGGRATACHGECPRLQGDGAQRRLPPRRAVRPPRLGRAWPRRRRPAGLSTNPAGPRRSSTTSRPTPSSARAPTARGRGVVRSRRAPGPLAGAPGARRPGGLARHRDRRRGGPRRLRRAGRAGLADGRGAPGLGRRPAGPLAEERLKPSDTGVS